VPGNLRGMPTIQPSPSPSTPILKAAMDVIADFSAYPQWALAVKKAEKVIMDTALKELKHRVEA
jgi:hypothetical protein